MDKKFILNFLTHEVPSRFYQLLSWLECEGQKTEEAQKVQNILNGYNKWVEDILQRPHFEAVNIQNKNVTATYELLLVETLKKLNNELHINDPFFRAYLEDLNERVSMFISSWDVVYATRMFYHVIGRSDLIIFYGRKK